MYQTFGNWGAALSLLIALAACRGQEERPGEVDVFDGIAADEAISIMGTEPFWSMEVTQDALTYSTPDNIDGVTTQVTRFAGNNGLGLSGVLDGEALQVAVTPGECSDGMSDRIYPFTATATLGEKQLEGCAYTASQPFEGDEAP